MARIVLLALVLVVVAVASTMGREEECCHDLCRTTKCAGGHQCVYQQVTCFRAPCCPTTTCVPTEVLLSSSTCMNARCAHAPCKTYKHPGCQDSGNCFYPLCSNNTQSGSPWCA